MFTQFFGSYLLNKGLVTAEQLSAALAVEKETRLRLGVLAINAGYMTAEQVEMVHAEQQKVDRRIGDIACDMGFLTYEQLVELLGSQGSAHLRLGQALVNAGAMTNAEFESAIKNYKAENSLTEVDFDENNSDRIDELVSRFYNFKDDSRSKYLSAYVTLLFKNIIRFIGSDFTPLSAVKLSDMGLEFACSQKITGDFSCNTVIEGYEQAYVGFAARYAEEQFDTVDEMVQAVCGEFLNLHNGLYVVNISNEMGTELELEPQVYYTENGISGEVTVIPLVFPFGTIYFGLIM